MTKLLAGVLTAIFLMTGCKDRGDDEYIGKWVHIKSEKRTMEIVRNGDTYIVRNTEPGMTSGKFETTSIPASRREDGLQINNGFGTVVLVVDKSTGYLTSVVGEFKRVR